MQWRFDLENLGDRPPRDFRDVPSVKSIGRIQKFSKGVAGLGRKYPTAWRPVEVKTRWHGIHKCNSCM